MKHNAYLLITLSIATPCVAMEKEKPNLQEITAIKNPRQAFFLTDNRAVINGESGCSIVDLRTNSEVKRISEDDRQTLVLNHNKTALALYNTEKIEIFYIEEKNELCHPIDLSGTGAKIISALLDHKNTIFVTTQHDRFPQFVISSINYKDPFTSSGEFYKNSSGSGLPNILLYHPTKQCLYRATLNHPSIIYTSDSNSLNTPKHITTLSAHPHLFECSPDGSLLAVSNLKYLYFLDCNHPTLGDKHNRSPILFSEQNKIINIAFHPNSAYIAIILENSCREDNSDKQIFIKYLETTTIKKENIITIIEDDSIDFTAENAPSSLSFDINGKYALITLYNRCFRVPIPFKVIYQDDAKERTTFVHWLFKNYQVDDNPVLPDDIRTAITRMLLETLKR
jgi:hypothetical protein